MGHHVRGFIASEDSLRRAAASLPGAEVVPLRLGFAFLPVSEPAGKGQGAFPFEHLVQLTPALVAWAQEQSRLFPLAYIETDYFGGSGEQSAVAWAGGQIVFGPARTVDRFENGKYVPTPLLEGAINRAVRHLGVERGDARDEFDALSLGRHRSNAEWLAEAQG